MAALQWRWPNWRGGGSCLVAHAAFAADLLPLAAQKMVLADSYRQRSSRFNAQNRGYQPTKTEAEVAEQLFFRRAKAAFRTNRE